MKKNKKKYLSFLNRIFIVLSVIIISVVLVKASDRFIGVIKGENKPYSRCPNGMAEVTVPGGDFCIDIYEASAPDSCPYISPGNQTETRANLEKIECLPFSVPAKKPWVNISQDQAEYACAKAGKRLASNQEWQAAALGTPDLKENWGPDDCQVDKNWPLQPGLTGNGKNCISGSGVYDMVGNVWEWVRGVATDGIYEGQKLPQQGYVDGTDGKGMAIATNQANGNPNYFFDHFWIKNTGTRGIARGGYWDNKSEAGQYSAYLVSPPSYTGVGVGFRCAK
jgi:formylglycine-generating enzyme required for sulfatase activity